MTIEATIDKWLAVRKTMAPEIKPDKCGLLIIDMQEYQVRKDWAVYKLSNALVPGMLDYFMEQTVKVAEPNIRKLIELFRKNNLRIIYTTYASFQKDGSDLPQRTKVLNNLAAQHLKEMAYPHKDHPGAQIIDILHPEENDLVIQKNVSGVFTTNKFEFLLRNMGIEQLFVTGVVTNMCVEGAARTASELGFDVFLVGDACAAWTPEIQKNTLKSFALLFGYVMTTEEALNALKKRLSI